MAAPLTRAQLLELTDRRRWRAWLKRNYKTEKEIWLVYHKKSSGKGRIAYNDAVEEALCFGWIDSTVRRLDERRFAQRFSPRKPGRAYSQANKERLHALVAAGKVMKDVLLTLGDLSEPLLKAAPDILRALRARPEAWANYQSFSESYRRIRIAFIEGARGRPAEFQKRLNYFVKMTEKNKQFGFGGIDKYY